jgi:DNA modification methylase
MIRILLGKAEDRLKEIGSGEIQLTSTSCPYFDQRAYANGNDYNFPTVAHELFRVTCDGGIVAWNEGLTCRNCDEVSEPYEHLLGFKQVGFKLMQTVIVRKDGIPFPGRYRWGNQFEFLWIFLKGNRPRAFNKQELRDRINKQAGKNKNAAQGRSGKEDSLRRIGKEIAIGPLGYRSNVWDVPVGFNKSTLDRIAYRHPAIQSEFLADSIVRAYSKPDDTVLDIFSGSGTTAKVSFLNNRESVNIERSKRYVSLSVQRLEPYTKDIQIF